MLRWYTESNVTFSLFLFLSLSLYLSIYLTLSLYAPHHHITLHSHTHNHTQVAILTVLNTCNNSFITYVFPSLSPSLNTSSLFIHQFLQQPSLFFFPFLHLLFLSSSCVPALPSLPCSCFPPRVSVFEKETRFRSRVPNRGFKKWIKKVREG